MIDEAITNECVNPYSYGEICTGCNACGRFDESKKFECYEKVCIEVITDTVEHLNDPWYHKKECMTNICHILQCWSEHLEKCLEQIDWSDEE